MRNLASTQPLHSISTRFPQGKVLRGTAAIGCPVEQSSALLASCGRNRGRAALPGRVQIPLKTRALTHEDARNGIASAPEKRFFSAHAEAEDRKLRKELNFGGPCFEGTLRKPTQCFRIEPRGRGDSGIQSLSKTLDAGRARELHKCAQPATQLLSVHCLYQPQQKSASPNRFFPTNVYRQGAGCCFSGLCFASLGCVMISFSFYSPICERGVPNSAFRNYEHV